MRPYDWVKRIEGSLLEAKQIPLWGHVPSFPWEKCTKRLSGKFSIPSLALEERETKWRSSGELLQGMGSHPILLSLELSPISGVFYWAFSREDLAKLTALTLPSKFGSEGFSDLELQEGYYRFLGAETLLALDDLNMYDGLSLKLGEEIPLPEDEGALCTDIAIKIKETTLWGRLICPSSFLQPLRAHFEETRPSLLERAKTQEISVEVHFEVGSTSLSLRDLKNVVNGDLIVLDRCSLDPKEHKGLVTLTLGNTPLFQARLHKGELKILDYSFFNEENTDMPGKYFDDDQEEEDEDELDNDFEEETEDLEEEDDDEDEEDDEDEDNEEEGQEESAWSPPVEGEKSQIEEIVSSADIPVTLTVELGKLRMNLSKLLELKPGNVLELSMTPEKPVDVCMNGKRIAKAELIRLGEVLGIKILRMGAL